MQLSEIPKTLQKRGQAQIERKTQQPESQISTITSMIAHTHQKDRKMLLCDAHNGRLFYFSSRERRLFRGRTDEKWTGGDKIGAWREEVRRRGFESEGRRLCANRFSLQGEGRTASLLCLLSTAEFQHLLNFIIQLMAFYPL